MIGGKIPTKYGLTDLERCNILMMTMRNIYEIIFKQTDYQCLAKKLCSCISENQLYSRVWIALSLNKLDRFTAIGESGWGTMFSPIYKKLKRGELTLCARITLEQSVPVAILNPKQACATCALSEHYGNEGVMTVRLDYNGKTYGILATTMPGILIADQNEHNLLQDLGRNIAFAVHQRQLWDEKGKREAVLAESEEFKSKLLSNSPNPILVIEPDTSIKYVNPALKKLTGFSSSDLIGVRPPYPFWTEETLEKTTRDLHKFMNKGVKSARELFTKKDGTRFLVEVTAMPVKARGQLKYYLSSWVDVTEQVRLKENMQFYIREMTMAQEEERKRIARDLHDETAQNISSLYDYIDNILLMANGVTKEAGDLLEQLRARIDQILEGVHRFIHELRPVVLDQLGLIPSLEILIDEATKLYQLDCRLHIHGAKRHLSAETELVIFRIAQEALSNIRKHSKATRVIVVAKFTKKGIKLIITDNGIGFKLPDVLSSFARTGKLGLMSMEERAHLLNGQFRVKSDVGKGTSVEVQIPV
jgi:PAS domain S-box-containing protein